MEAVCKILGQSKNIMYCHWKKMFAKFKKIGSVNGSQKWMIKINVGYKYRFLTPNSDFPYQIQDFKNQNQTFSNQIQNFYKTIHILPIKL